MRDSKGAGRRPGNRTSTGPRSRAAAQRGPSAPAPGGKGGGGRAGPPSSRKRRFDKRWLAFIPALAIVWLAYTYAKIAVTLPAPTRIIQGAQGLTVLDRNGNLIQDFGGRPGSGDVVPLDQVSPDLVNATVAAEDAGFWDNPGVSPRGLARAAYENLAFWKTGGLFKGSGGSSITQQLAKNLYIKPEDRAQRNPMRKLRETLIAFELTRRYSKSEILSWYLSTNNYGNGAYGVEAAAYRYFNKAPADLTLSEAALLAALPRSPAYYDPIANPDTAREGQRQVLAEMVRHRYIDQKTMDDALAEPIALNEGHAPGSDTSQSPAPHFAEYVRELLPSLIGKDKIKGNVVVTTTLDLDLQAKAQKAVASQIKQLDSKGVTNGALVAIDPATGEVLAMVGSPDFNDDSISGQVNNATSLNQPGSTMKPITYLTTFVNEGWTPSTPIKDEPIPWNDGVLGNADGWYRGNITVRQALGSSLNVPAVKALQSVGLPSVVAMARKLGISTIDDNADYGSAFTLGAVDVNLLDMTYVYSTFANDGVQTGMNSVLGLPAGSRQLDPIAVLKVETQDGKTLWQADHHSVRVAPAKETFYLTDILSDDSARQSMFGLNSPLKLPRPAAVKSGSSDETRDAWTIGYTPQLVAGVWVGNANNAPIPNGTSTYTAAPIWRSFMLAALDGQPALAFTAPQDTKSAGLKATATPPKQPTAVPTATPAQGTDNAGLKATPTRTTESGGLKATPTRPGQTPVPPSQTPSPRSSPGQPSATPTPVTQSGGQGPTRTPAATPTSTPGNGQNRN